MSIWENHGRTVRHGKFGASWLLPLLLLSLDDVLVIDSAELCVPRRHLEHRWLRMLEHNGDGDDDSDSYALPLCRLDMMIDYD